MKRVGAVVTVVLVSMVLLSQAALAGTSVSVGVSAPGIYFEASSVRPSPHHVWVPERWYWEGHHRVCAPGYWRYQPPVRTVYVPVHPRPYYDCRDRDHHRGYDRHWAHSDGPRPWHDHDGGSRHDRDSRYDRDHDRRD